MNKCKKLLSVALIALMTMGVLPVVSSADTYGKTQADTIVATAEMYWGLTREGVKRKTYNMGKTPYYPSWTADWCAWFVTNAAVTSEISSSIIPRLTNCDRTWYQNRGQYHKGKGWGGSYTPQRGDILYFDFNGDNWSDHTGIVRFVKNGRVYTVEGNYLHRVSGNSMTWTNNVIFKNYSQYNTDIRGYSTPRYRPISNSFVYRYNANGGTGTMKDTLVKSYGTKTQIRKNTFTRKGYVFTGWTMQRKSDGKWWYYKSASEYGWYKSGEQPAGWPKGVWPDKKVANGNNTYVDNDVVTLYAVWKKESEVENSKIWKRIYGANRYDTMQKIVSTGFKKTGGTVVVASGGTFKDAVAASGFAGLYNAPIVLTAKSNLSSQAQTVLKQLKPTQVYVVGGNLAVTNKVKNQIAQVTGATVTRVSGDNSVLTSVRLAFAGQGSWSKDGIAVITTNSSFKDALSISPIAYAKKYPVFLSDKGKTVAPEVLDAMAKLEIKKVIIVGGEKAVSTTVEAQLKKAGIEIETRLAGDTAVLTSKAIAKWGLKNGMKVNNLGVATSQDFPDALAGGAFCGSKKTVLLLADDDAMTNATFPGAYKKDITRGYIFGGQTAVGLKTYKKLDASTK